MIKEIKDLLDEINPDYRFYYEFKSMFNVKADDIRVGDRFVLLDETSKGKYQGRFAVNEKLSKLTMYFGICVDNHFMDAIEKEEKREEIEDEVLKPFIRKIGDRFVSASEFNWFNCVNFCDAPMVMIQLDFNLQTSLGC